MTPQLYGLEHILFVVVTAIVFIVSPIIIRKYVPKKYYVWIIKGIAISVLILLIINRIVTHLWYKNLTFLTFLPDSFCSTTGFVLSISVIFCKPDKYLYTFVMFAGALGGTLTLFYPDFLSEYPSFFTASPFTGMLYHSGMLYLFILSIALGYWKPTLSKVWCVIAGLTIYEIWGVFGNEVLGQQNNMYLKEPLIEGTPFSFWFVGILFILLCTIISLIFDYFVIWRPNKKISSKK